MKYRKTFVSNSSSSSFLVSTSLVDYDGDISFRYSLSNTSLSELDAYIIRDRKQLEEKLYDMYYKEELCDEDAEGIMTRPKMYIVDLPERFQDLYKQACRELDSGKIMISGSVFTQSDPAILLFKQLILDTVKKQLDKSFKEICISETIRKKMEIESVPF